MLTIICTAIALFNLAMACHDFRIGATAAGLVGLGLGGLGLACTAVVLMA
jgi:hypothetical protein